MTDDTFSTLAEDFVAQGLATHGTMMGHPCLRASGAFFASGGKTGDQFIVKIPKARVQEEIEAGRGAPFAPGGRTFREWVEVTHDDSAHAREILFEALELIST